MYKPTDRQLSLGSLQPHLSAAARTRLESSWAGGFRRQVMPLLLEAEGSFADLYSDSNGRPNWSLARKLGLMFIQELQDLDDQELLDALSFDARFAYALSLAPDDAYLTRRSYVDFRGRLVSADPSMERLRGLFVRIGDAMIEDLGLSTSAQRLDSTQIASNICNRTRNSLLASVLRLFLRCLSECFEDRLGQLSKALLEWGRRDEPGWFAKPSADVQRARQEQLGRWLLEVVVVFSDDEQVCEHEAYMRCARVLDEYFDIDDPAARFPIAPMGASHDEPDGDGVCGQATLEDFEIERIARPGGNSLRSPFDPDATCGHKGTGYSVQIAETYGNDGPEVLTDFALTPAYAGDSGQAVDCLERLETIERSPDMLLADSIYIDSASLVTTQTMGVDLVGPVIHGNRLHNDFVGRDAFLFDSSGERVLRCPMGQAPIAHRQRTTPNKTKGKSLFAFFERKVCSHCPLLEQCAVHAPKNGKQGNYTLEILPKLLARDRAYSRQRTARFWESYALRAGIEATISELKRAHGMAKLRVRGKARVLMAVTAKLIACNIKRWLKACSNRSDSGPSTHERADSEPGRAKNTLEWFYSAARNAITAVVHENCPMWANGLSRENPRRAALS